MIFHQKEREIKLGDRVSSVSPSNGVILVRLTFCKLQFQGNDTVVEIQVEVSTTFDEITTHISHQLFQTSYPTNQLIFQQQECQIDPSDRVGSVSLNDRPIVVRLTTVRLKFQGGGREVELEVEVSTTFDEIATQISHQFFQTFHPVNHLFFRQQGILRNSEK
jgi:hypothetical protein